MRMMDVNGCWIQPQTKKETLIWLQPLAIEQGDETDAIIIDTIQY